MIEMETGRIVVKIAGREGGQYGVVVKKVDENFVMVTGPKLLTGVKRRKANVLHLEPTSFKLEIKDDATDEEVIEAYRKSGLVEKLGLRFPSAADVKAEKKTKEEKAAKAPKVEPKAKEAKPKKAKAEKKAKE